jgi:putative SOS response-associated peptidase YedK
MCGRFTITLEPADLQEELGLGEFPEDFIPRYNVAPTQPVAIVRDPVRKTVEWMRWGLIPFWAKDPSIGVKMINARAETLDEKPSFRQAFSQRRCLLLADGFYEWQKGSGKEHSIPHFFHLAKSKPFFFAGLWDTWKDTGGTPLNSCTIITCAANELVGEIHERMPVILDTVSAWNWLKTASQKDLQQLLQPYPANQMTGYVVGTAVNSPAVESSGLVHPAG